MLKGCFKIQIAHEAEKLLYENLTQDEKSVLFHKHAVNSDYDLYRFEIVPVIEFIDNPVRVPRKTKKASYEQVDRCLVHINCPSSLIKILSIFPTTCTADRQWLLDLTAEGKAGLFQEGIGHLKVEGIFKFKINSRKFLIYAHRNTSFAQWIFLRDWVQTTTDFSLEFLCAVPRELVADRYFVCDAQFQANGRKVETAKNRIVQLPA